MDIFSTLRSRSIKLDKCNQPRSRSDTADFGSLVWTFDPNNNYQSLELTELVYNKWIPRMMIIINTVCTVLAFAGAPMAVYVGIWTIYCMVVTAPRLLFLILSFNRDARGFIVRSFDFWIKIVYSELAALMWSILYHQVERKRKLSDLPEWLGYTTCIAMCILSPLFLALVGGMDALPRLKYEWKACLIGFVAIIMTAFSIYFQLLAPAEDNYTFEIQATGTVKSIHSLLANADGMLSLFLWKQTIDVIRNKDRCVSIIYRPYLRWKTADPPRLRFESMELQIPNIIEMVIDQSAT